MVQEIFKQRVGRTPLVRAKKLEKHLGISKIYLKLEGNNPSGHREDRLAYLIIRDALTRGKHTICMATYGTIGGSLSYLSQFFDIKCVFYIPEKTSIRRRKLLENDHVEIRTYGRSYNQCVEESRRIAKKNNWYNANYGLANSIINMYAFSYIAKEITQQLKETLDTVFCQTFDGSAISGLHMGFKQLWVTEDIERLPQLWTASTSHGNAIIESFKQGEHHLIRLKQKDIKKTRYSKYTVNWYCQNGQNALNALYDTYGKALGVTDEELVEYTKQFKTIEKIKFTRQNGYAIAGFMKAAENNLLPAGNHVIILDDGKIHLDIQILKKRDLNISYKKFLERLDEWLVEFTDPMDELKEAVENAFTDGYVLGAYDRGVLVGIAILSRSNFDTFFPKYHLSYIATKKTAKGKGIASELLRTAIQVSNGELSLHVETNNKKAIRLYEKMGLRKKYYRMIYAGAEHESQL